MPSPQFRSNPVVTSELRTWHAYYSHAGEECGVCIEGRIELTVNGRSEVLEPGDAFYFSSTLPHRWRNVGKGPARMIAANTPPTF